MKHIFETPHDGNYYFGYYDKSPFSKDGTKILAIKTNFIDHTKFLAVSKDHCNNQFSSFSLKTLEFILNKS